MHRGQLWWADLTLAALPGNVAIPRRQSGLSTNSVLNVTQLATIDRGSRSDRLMAQVDGGLVRALELRES